MILPKSILHLFLAATLVFVNLACPCGSASASMSMNGAIPISIELAVVEDQHSQHQHRQVQESATLDQAQNDCPHEFTDNQCPDCTSYLAVSCDDSALTLPASKLVKVGPDDDSGQMLASLPLTFLPLPVPISTRPVHRATAFFAESPVQRHDRQLK